MSPQHPASALLEETERRRLQISRSLLPGERVKLGQFFTPAGVARILAHQVDLTRSHLRVLDPGAGVGSLTAGLVGRLLEERTDTALHVTAVEVDRTLTGPLDETLRSCAAAAGGRFSYEQRSEDFLAWAMDQLSPGLFGATSVERFDLVLMNPPYRKINANSSTRRLLERGGVATTNLYTAFLALAQGLLAPGGQVVAITPRSFCNGTYFRDFRRSFLADLGLQAVHVFQSRSKAFAGDAVLQENVIFSAVKGHHPETITLTTSDGVDDDMVAVRQVPLVDVVRPEDANSFIHLPIDEGQAGVARWMRSLPCTLRDLGLSVSTGRVVDFRARQWLRTEPDATTAPLVYQAHLRAGRVEWPLPAFRKPQHLAVTEENVGQFVNSGLYVLTKRFSSKEERRRVTAAVFDPAEVPRHTLVGFENHTNVFHDRGAGIRDADLARGLSTFLNSSLVDGYFRQFSGHTQVNSGDLRSLRYPDHAQLLSLGAATGAVLPDQEKIDALVEEHLGDFSDDVRNPLSAQRKIEEALAALRALDMPREQLNERSALSLLALLDLKPADPWSAAAAPLRGIAAMMDFFAEHYGKTYRTGSRETVRRQTVHQFMQAGLLLYNSDKPDRPVNSPRAVYQIEQSALLLLQRFGQPGWEAQLVGYRHRVQSLRERHAAEREMKRIPVTLPDGGEILLSPGGQNVLIKEIVDGFCPRFAPGGQVLYVGDADVKWAVKNEAALAELGLALDRHGKMPDLVVHDTERGWLLLVEAVTSHGPVDPKRHEELKRLFAGSKVGLVFVTAFLTRAAFAGYARDISWETEVWCADSPTHLVHFDGPRFLGPYAAWDDGPQPPRA